MRRSPLPKRVTDAVDAVIEHRAGALRALAEHDEIDPSVLANAWMDVTQARIELLERALLETWYDAEWGRCQLCRAETPEFYAEDIAHAVECLIPEIESRHQDD